MLFVTRHCFVSRRLGAVGFTQVIDWLENNPIPAAPGRGKAKRRQGAAVEN
jgi:hypothetical protein